MGWREGISGRNRGKPDNARLYKEQDITWEHLYYL